MNPIASFFAAPRRLPLFTGGASASALAAAYISQYGFGLDPCQLCYYQRVPYAAVIALSFAAFFSQGRLARGFIGACAVLFLGNAGLAFFHVGVEHKWWEGLSSCANYALPANPTVEEMRAFIMSREKPVRCDVPAFVLFGISMAGYNALLSAFLFCTTSSLLKKAKA